MTGPSPLRVAMIGWGAIGRTAAALLEQAPVQLVAVGIRDGSAARPDVPASAQLITEPDALAATEPDVVAEAAGRESVAPWGRAALGAGADLVVSAVSAFADRALLDELRALAVANGARIEIQPGALAGVDALSAARLMGLDHVEHRMVKPPAAWTGTPAEDRCDLDALTEVTTFWHASAAETATAFPQNANAAMTTALAGLGPERTDVELVADPSATTNRHEIRASGGFGSLEVVIANNPLPSNPKSSAMAALGLARAITNRASAIAI